MRVRAPFVWLEALLPPSVESQPQKTPGYGQGAGAADVFSVSSPRQLCSPSLPSASPPHTVFSAWPWWGGGLTAGGEEQPECPPTPPPPQHAERSRAWPRTAQAEAGPRGEQASLLSVRGEIGDVGCVSCRGPDQRAVNDRILRVAPGTQEGAAGASSHCGWNQAIGAATFRDVTDPPARVVGSWASCSVRGTPHAPGFLASEWRPPWQRWLGARVCRGRASPRPSLRGRGRGRRLLVLHAPAWCQDPPRQQPLL